MINECPTLCRFDLLLVPLPYFQFVFLLPRDPPCLAPLPVPHPTRPATSVYPGEGPRPRRERGVGSREQPTQNTGWESACIPRQRPSC